MIYIYTVFLLFTPFFSFLCPVQLSILGTLGREFSFLIIIGWNLIKIFIKKETFSKTQIYTIFFIGIIIFYSIFADNMGEIIVRLLIYLSGPLLFLSITMSNIKNIDKKISIISFICLLFLLLNLIIYRYQNILLLTARIDTDTIYKHLYRNGNMRFFGITFMPTVMAFICVIVLVFVFNKIKVLKLLPIYSLYLTGARLYIPGIMLAVYQELNKKWKIYLSFFFTISGLFIVLYFIRSSDSSLIRHFDDLFVTGPYLVLKNFYGCGLGNIKAFKSSSEINLESDIYLYFIQFGFIGGYIYILIFLSMYKDYLNKYYRNDKILKLGRMMVIIYLISSFFLPLTLQRTLGNLFWIYEGVIYKKWKMINQTN